MRFCVVDHWNNNKSVEVIRFFSITTFVYFLNYGNRLRKKRSMEPWLKIVYPFSTILWRKVNI